MNPKYYSYSSSYVYKNNNGNIEEEQISLNNDKGRIIKAKNGKIVKDKKISKKEFKSYLADRNLDINDEIIENALKMFNNTLLPILPKLKQIENTNPTNELKFLQNKSIGLDKKERDFINKTLNKKELIKFIVNRYNVNKNVFKNMTKKQILADLKHPRQIQRGGYRDLQEPQVGFEGSKEQLTNNTLDYSFPKINKTN